MYKIFALLFNSYSYREQLMTELFFFHLPLEVAHGRA